MNRIFTKIRDVRGLYQLILLISLSSLGFSMPECSHSPFVTRDEKIGNDALGVCDKEEARIPPPCTLLAGEALYHYCRQGLVNINFIPGLNPYLNYFDPITIIPDEAASNFYNSGTYIFDAADAFDALYVSGTPFVSFSFDITAPGCTNTETLTFYIYPDQVYEINSIVITSLCEVPSSSGVTILLDNYLSASSPSSGDWTAVNPDHAGLLINNNTFNLAAAEVGSYTFSVTSSLLEECSTPATLTLEVFPEPALELMTYADPACGSVDLCNYMIDEGLEIGECTTLNGYNWSYYLNDPFDLTAIPGGHFDFSGTLTQYHFVLEYIDTETGCLKRIEAPLSGVAATQITVTTVDTLCQGQNLDLHDLVSDSQGLTIIWYPHNSQINSPDLTSPLPSSTIVNTGIYWAVGSGVGSECTEPVMVTISPPTNLNPAIEDTTLTLCAGGTDLVLNDLLTSGTTPSGSWYLYDGGNWLALSSGIWAYQNYSLDTPYTLTYELSDGGCTTSDSILITVSSTSAPVMLSPISLCETFSGMIDLDTLFSSTPLTGGSWEINPSIPITLENIINSTDFALDSYVATYVPPDNSCTTSASAEITITDGFVADFFSGITFCEGVQIDLTDPNNFSIIPSAGGEWTLEDSGVLIENGLLDTDGLSGNVSLEYNVGTGDCSASFTGSIFIDSFPDIVFNLDTLCSVGPFNLNNNPWVSVPGTWSGIQVTNNLFNPSEPGTYTVDYHYETASGFCSLDTTLTIVFMPSPLSPAALILCPGQQLDLDSLSFLNGWPATWYNISLQQSITGGLYTAPADLPHTDMIQATVLSGDCTLLISPFSIHTFSSSTASWTPPVFCSGDDLSLISLNSFLDNGVSDEGVWSEEDLNIDYVFLNPADGIYYLSIPNNAAGDYTVSYTCCGSCSNTVSQVISVVDMADISPAWQEITVCSGSAPIRLDSLVSLAGGTLGGSWDDDINWNGIPPFISDGYFLPQDLNSGTYTLQYQVGNGQACDTIQTGFITVLEGNDASWIPPTAYCSDANPIDLDSYFDTQDLPIHSWSGAPGTNYILFNRWFHPDSVDAGIYPVILQIGEGECADTLSYSIELIDLNPDIVLPSVCLDAGLVDLNEFIYNELLNNGSWSGEFIENNHYFNTIPQYGTVNPGTYPLTYEVTYQNCTQSLSYSLIVQDSSTPDFIDFSLCQGDVIDLETMLQGADTGGDWYSTDPEVSIINGIWNTTGLSAGTYPLIYAVGYGSCRDSLLRNIHVNVSSDPGWSPTFLCVDEDFFDLDELITGDPSGQWFTPNSAVIYLDHYFNAELAGPGFIPVTYTVGVGTSCQRDSTAFIDVNYQADPSFNDTIICFGSPAFPLDMLATGSPGGYWTGGPWVSEDSLFIPPPDGIGGSPGGIAYPVVHHVGYNQCYDYIIGTVYVINPIPLVVTDTSFCEGMVSTLFLDSLLRFDLDAYDFLTGDFESDSLVYQFVLDNINGFWTGDLVSNNIFNEGGQPLAAGTYHLFYNYGPCEASEEFTVHILPKVDAGYEVPPQICHSDDPIALSEWLTTGTPGGSWYGEEGNLYVQNDTLYPAFVPVGADVELWYTVGDAVCGADSMRIIQASLSLSATWLPIVLCEGGETVDLNTRLLSLSPGIWSGDGISADGIFNPILPGEFIITFETSLGDCTDSHTDTVSVVGSLLPLLSDTLICEGVENFDLNLLIQEGANSGHWVGGPWVVDSQFFNTSLLIPGTWNVLYAVGTGSCQNTATTTVTIADAIAPNWFISESFCEGDEDIELIDFVSLGSSGGNWSAATAPGLVNPDGHLHLSVFPAGTYPITYTTGTVPCISDSTIAITILSQVSPMAQDTVICNTSDVIVLDSLLMVMIPGHWTATADPPYLEEGIFNPAGLGGIYNFTFTPTNTDCSVQVSSTITVVAPPLVSFDNNASLCATQLPFDLNELNPMPAGGLWSEPDGILTDYITDSNFYATEAGIYAVSYQAFAGPDSFCGNTITQDLSFVLPPDPAWDSFTLCTNSDPVQLDEQVSGNSGGVFTGVNVINNQFNPEGLSDGDYFITYTVGAASCDSSYTQSISVISQPDASWSTGSFCASTGIIDLDTLVSGNSGGLWTGSLFINEDNSLNPSIMPPGPYTLTYTVGMPPCVDSSTQTIIIHPTPTLEAGEDLTLCEGEEITLSGTSSAFTQLLWTGGYGSFSPPDELVTQYLPVANEEELTVFLQVSDSCGSIISDSLHLHILPAGSIEISGEDYITVGDSTLLTATGASVYLWSPETGLSCTLCNETWASPQEDIIYTISTTDECIEPVLFSIEVNNDKLLLLPTAFSPNGDGYNDAFGVIHAGLKAYEITIYNRWGQPVFWSADPNQRWDGFFKGKRQEMEVYVYRLRYKFYDDPDFKEKGGNITLIH